MKTRKRAATRTGKYCSSARVFGVSMSEEESASEVLAKKIAGDIVLAKTPSAAIQKWRNIFKISQRALAEEMGIMSSVISDYESGRRSSPGVGMIKKIVSALISIDQKTGSVVCNEFNSMYTDEKLNDVIIDIRELDHPTDIKSIKAAVLINKYIGSHVNADFIGLNLGLNKNELITKGIDDYWLFGYGMDLDGQYKDIEHIGWVEKKNKKT